MFSRLFRVLLTFIITLAAVTCISKGVRAEDPRSLTLTQSEVPNEIFQIFRGPRYQCVTLDGRCLFNVYDRDTFEFDRSELISQQLGAIANSLAAARNATIEVKVKEDTGTELPVIFAEVRREQQLLKKLEIMTILNEDLQQSALLMSDEVGSDFFKIGIAEAITAYKRERQMDYRIRACLSALGLLVAAILVQKALKKAPSFKECKSFFRIKLSNEGHAGLLRNLQKIYWSILITLRATIAIAPIAFILNLFPETRPFLYAISVIGIRGLKGAGLVFLLFQLGLALKALNFWFENLRLEETQGHRKKAAISTKARLICDIIDALIAFTMLFSFLAAILGAWYLITAISIVAVGLWVILQNQARDGISGLWHVFILQKYVRGDYVKLGEKSGIVKRVSLYHTVVFEPWNEAREYTIPHAMLDSLVIENQSVHGWVEIVRKINSRYEDNVSVVIEAIEETFDALKKIAPAGALKSTHMFGPEHGTAGLEWTIVLSISTQKLHCVMITNEMFRILQKEFLSRSLSFPHAYQLDLHWEPTSKS